MREMLVTLLFAHHIEGDKLNEFWTNHNDLALLSASVKYSKGNLRLAAASKDSKRALAAMMVLSLMDAKLAKAYGGTIKRRLKTLADNYERFWGSRFLGVHLKSKEFALCSIQWAGKISEREGDEGVALSVNSAIIAVPEVYLPVGFAGKDEKNTILYCWWFASDTESRNLKIKLDRLGAKKKDLKEKYRVMERIRHDMTGFHPLDL